MVEEGRVAFPFGQFLAHFIITLAALYAIVGRFGALVDGDGVFRYGLLGQWEDDVAEGGYHFATLVNLMDGACFAGLIGEVTGAQLYLIVSEFVTEVLRLVVFAGYGVGHLQFEVFEEGHEVVERLFIVQIHATVFKGNEEELGDGDVFPRDSHNCRVVGFVLRKSPDRGHQAAEGST